jgi:all-trans-retinol dehydrogenase (NAD+)
VRTLTCDSPLRIVFSTNSATVSTALSFHEGLTEELRHLYLPHSKARAVRTSVICPAHYRGTRRIGHVRTLTCDSPLRIVFSTNSATVSTSSGLWLTTMSIAQHIIEPYYASFTPLGRALPTWIYGGKSVRDP